MSKKIEEYSQKLENSFAHLSTIIKIVKLQIDLLEKMGFSDENMKKVVMDLTPNQKSAFEDIGKQVELYEQRQIRKIVKKNIKTDKNRKIKNLIKI